MAQLVAVQPQVAALAQAAQAQARMALGLFGSVFPNAPGERWAVVLVQMAQVVWLLQRSALRCV